jgi:hypothetical protein
MKRWAVLLGRCGTTVIAIGLALFLVSIIPHVQIDSFSTAYYVPSPSFSKGWYPVYMVALTELQTVRFIVTAANGTLNVYVLKVTDQAVLDWINQTYGAHYFSNVTCFDRFLDSHPASVAWKGEIHNGTISGEYVPTKITDITLVISNHGPNDVDANYSGVVFGSVAPVSKVQTLSEFAIPVGVAFTLPWLSNLLRAKKRRKD